MNPLANAIKGVIATSGRFSFQVLAGLIRPPGCTSEASKHDKMSIDLPWRQGEPFVS